MCKAKIHRVKVVEVNLHYEGSISIAKELLEASSIIPYEVVQVININTGARFETYAIEGKKGSGASLKGGTARLGAVGDLLIILAYVYIDDKEVNKFKPRIVIVNENNKIVKVG